MTDAAIQTPAAPVPHQIKWAVVLAVVLTAVLEVLDSTIVNVALPHIQSAFGMTSDQTTWILTSYIVASVVVMPLTGLMSRKFGRRRLVTTAILGFAAFSALCGMAQSAEMMVAFRLGQGLFGAFLIPLSQTILFDSFPREKRGEAMALFGLGVVVAPVLGPTLGAILTEYFSWRAVFYVNLPLAGFALMMMSGELQRDETRQVDIDWLGLTLMVTAIGALQFVLDQGESRDWFSSHIITVAATASAIAFLFFVWRGWADPKNIIDLKLFRDANFATANVAITVFGLSMFGTIALLPLFVQGLLDYPVLDAGYLFMPRGLAAGFSMVFTGAVLVRRFDPRALLFLGLLLTGTGNLMLSWLDLDASFWQLAWPGVVSGLGMGLFFVPISTLAFHRIPSSRQDEASGIYGVTRSIGSSVGIALIGWQYANRVQYHMATVSGTLTPYGAAVQHWYRAQGLSLTSPLGAGRLTGQIASQAQMLAFQDVFWLTALAAFVAMPLVIFMTRPDHSGGGGMAH